ncbi:hypothetical protein EYF80_058912 [Liparis tanakae]|uniref:Uncharacterized protein n=1 Tax=Liparis tanakae TaxID=230148 RepID=A0A4Z2EQ64_9TELE|nr:hypothetical protein EYF80_058912 [Liparis tanakae]
MTEPSSEAEANSGYRRWKATPLTAFLWCLQTGSGRVDKPTETQSARRALAGRRYLPQHLVGLGGEVEVEPAQPAVVVDADGALRAHEEVGPHRVEGHALDQPFVLPEGVLTPPPAHLVDEHLQVAGVIGHYRRQRTDRATASRQSSGLGFQATLFTAPPTWTVLTQRDERTSQNLTDPSSLPASTRSAQYLYTQGTVKVQAALEPLVEEPRKRRNLPEAGELPGDEGRLPVGGVLLLPQSSLQRDRGQTGDTQRG